jgi:phosphoglucomutase
MTSLAKIQAAGQAGQLLPSAVENLTAWLGASLPAWAQASIDELADRGAWAELNDRFYRFLEFGTGGMRGRTIGVVSTAAEQGKPGPQGTPAHAAIGCNVLNDFTLIRAVVGLFRYTHAYLGRTGSNDLPKLVIAHDVRHFSRHFCELAASTWTRLGGEAYIFDGPRSTPQLSFSVRWLKAHCGVVITASHNPPHDNGFKAYFDDGAAGRDAARQGHRRRGERVPLVSWARFWKRTSPGHHARPRGRRRLPRRRRPAALDPAIFQRVKLKVVVHQHPRRRRRRQRAAAACTPAARCTGAMSNWPSMPVSRR